MTSLAGVNSASVAGFILTATNTAPNAPQGLPPITPGQVQDGYGNPSPFFLSQTTVNFLTNGGMAFQLNGVALTASATNINAVCGTNPGLSGTGAFIIPVGTTAQRPATGIVGMLRYNTSLATLELCTSTGPDVWTAV